MAKSAQKPATRKPALAHIAIRNFMVPLLTTTILRLFAPRSVTVENTDYASNPRLDTDMLIVV